MTNNEIEAMAGISREGTEMIQDAIAYHVKDLDVLTAMDLVKSIKLIVRSERLKAAAIAKEIDRR